jgi:hypothetical protein
MWGKEAGRIDLEELTDFSHVVIGRQVGASEVFVELLAVDRELPADLGDRAMKTAEVAKVCSKIFKLTGHCRW